MKTEGIKRVFHAWNLIFQEHVEQLTALDSAGGAMDFALRMNLSRIVMNMILVK